MTFSWISAAEGRKFADLITEVTEQVRKLGPFEGYRKMSAVAGEKSDAR